LSKLVPLPDPEMILIFFNKRLMEYENKRDKNFEPPRLVEKEPKHGYRELILVRMK
jgi:hypothetical protein